MQRGLLLSATVLSFAVLTGLAFAAPGELDPRFGTGGVVSTATAPGSGSDRQDGFAIQPNRRILVAGSSDMGASAGHFQWRISRYTRNGVLDTSFGSGGTVLTNMSSAHGGEEHIWALALQPNRKIVAAGTADTPRGRSDFAVARYLPDGQLDGSFGDDGTVTTAIAPGAKADEAFGVRVEAGGRIVVAGYADMHAGTASRDFAIARYLPNGQLDSSFNPDGNRPGIVVTDVAGGRDQLAELMIDAAGRIVVAGSATLGAGKGGTDFAVARYLSGGQLDRSFNPSGARPGIVTTTMAPGDNLDIAESMAIDAAGRIVVGGSADTGGFVFDLALARYNTDGSLDGSFGTGGKVLTNVGPGNTDEDLEGLVIQPTGKIIVGGSTAATAFFVDSDFMVARYNPHGTLDHSFGSGGIAVTPTAPGDADDDIFAIGLQSHTKLVAAGECVQASTGRDVCVARYRMGEAKG